MSSAAKVQNFSMEWIRAEYAEHASWREHDPNVSVVPANGYMSGHNRGHARGAAPTHGYPEGLRSVS